MGRKNIGDLTLADDFIFCRVMHTPSICKHFLAALGMDGDEVAYPGYLDPPTYAPKTVRVNLLRCGKVIYVTEIYLIHNVTDCGQIYTTLRSHEDALVWEMVVSRALGHIKDIRQICITGTDPCGSGVVQFEVARYREGLTCQDWPRGIVLCSGVHVVPNAHPDVLALLDLVRGQEQPDNAFAAQVMARLNTIKQDPQVAREYAQWREVPDYD